MQDECTQELIAHLQGKNRLHLLIIVFKERSGVAIESHAWSWEGCQESQHLLVN